MARDPKKQLSNLMDALADSIAVASDDDIVVEAHEGGEDIPSVSAEVSTVIRRAIKDHRKKKMTQEKNDSRKKGTSDDRCRNTSRKNAVARYSE